MIFILRRVLVYELVRLLSTLLDRLIDELVRFYIMGRTASPEAKRRIMDAAHELFNSEGIKAVSADTIIDRADVAKMTLYNHFPTKDDLAAAYVHERSDRWIAWLADRVGKRGRTPKQRILALFDVFDEWFRSDDYFGCPFHRAAAEFRDEASPIHQEVLRNKKQLRQFVAQLVHAAGLADEARIVSQLMVLTAGAETMANIEGNPRFAHFARQAAARLIAR